MKQTNYLAYALRLEDEALEHEEQEIAIKAIQDNIDNLLTQIFND